MNRRNLTRILSALLALALVFALTACAGKTEAPAPEPEASVPEAVTPEPAPEPEPKSAADSKLVGVSLPNEELWRWKQDGEIMRKQLQQLGYEVDLQFADDDPLAQADQLENMIAKGAKVIIVAHTILGWSWDKAVIEAESRLYDVLKQAEEAGCAVIAYDRSISSDAVSCYAAFDLWSVCAVQARFIVDQLDLDNAGDKVYNLEFIGGSPDDGDFPWILHDRALAILQKYIDAGTLNVVSGQIDFGDVATEGWSAEKAQERFENLLSTYYPDKPLHAVLAANDSTAQGAVAALATSYKNDVYPIITGWDCDIVSVKNILDGKQAMSVFMDTRNEAAKAVEMADALMKGAEPPSNGVYTTVDGAHKYPVFYVEPTVCTKDNIVEIMLDYGVYTAEELGLEP